MNSKNFIIKKSITKLASLSFIVLIIFIAYSQYDTKTFSLGFKRIQNLLGRMYPLDFSILPELKQPIIETINIALFSSILALCTTLILLPILTNVLFKLKIIPKIFSTGVFSGFVSIYLINILTSAKLLKEYAEEVEIKQLEAMESLGVSKFIIYKNAILSNLKPQVISVYFLTLESSIRGASVLGLVGAGGIGQRLWQELNHLRYDRVSIIIITLVILIFVIDLVSYYFRNLQNTSQLTFEKFMLRRNLVKFGIPVVIVGSILYVTNFINISQERFFIGLKQLNVLAKGIINPDLAYVPKMLSELFISIEIAFSATIFAAITAIFTSYLSSVNLFGKYKALGVKIFINILRTFPPIIVALIFFRGFGPGAISSFFALYIYTVGVMTKMYNEVLEGINNNVLLMTKSLGLGSFISYVKIIFNGYFPEFVTIVLYRFESNIKNSTILGMVGAGGIGHLLVNNIEYRNWNRISTLLIGLSLSIIIIENISYLIRMKVKK